MAARDVGPQLDPALAAKEERARAERLAARRDASLPGGKGKAKATKRGAKPSKLVDLKAQSTRVGDLWSTHRCCWCTIGIDWLLSAHTSESYRSPARTQWRYFPLITQDPSPTTCQQQRLKKRLRTTVSAIDPELDKMRKARFEGNWVNS